MQLELTKKQYELLLELASLGQIVRIVDKLSRPDKEEPEEELLFHLCSQAKNFGLSHLITEYEDKPAIKHLNSFNDLMVEFFKASESCAAKLKE